MQIVKFLSSTGQVVWKFIPYYLLGTIFFSPTLIFIDYMRVFCNYLCIPCAPCHNDEQGIGQFMTVHNLKFSEYISKNQSIIYLQIAIGLLLT